VTNRDDFLEGQMGSPPDEQFARPGDQTPPQTDSATNQPAPPYEQPTHPAEDTPPTQWSGPPAETPARPADDTPPQGKGPPHQQWSVPPPEQSARPPGQYPRSTGHPAASPPQVHQPAAPPRAGAFGDDTRTFSAPQTDQPPQQWRQQPAPPREPSPTGPRQGSQRSPGPGEADTPVGPPGSWTYFDTSELVPTRKVPPGRGWRGAIYKATFGLLNFGPSPDELRQAELEAKVRTLLRGHYKIGVLGKGGVGKTTVAVSVGSIFAQFRQEDRVVAIDADTAFGKLGDRVDPRAPGSYWDLTADQHLDTFADVRSRVGNNAAGLFVLPGESALARRRVLDPAIFRAATSRLDRHFTISIVDCGSTLDAPVTQEALRSLHALIVVSSPWVDGASAAGQTMEWLAHHGMTGLLHRTVVVLNDSDGHADKRTRAILVQQFASNGQVVIEVPFDSQLRPGGVIDVDNQMASRTRRRFLEIAAAIGENFPGTPHGPREQRPR
jgi:MinD-like ATPase involved in chromosome partitioning or flagellar assembly